MNDITALVQRVKTEAAAIDDTQWYLAKPSEVRALVEALEKAQKLATQQGNIACALFDEVTAQRQRIAELEGAEQKLCAANVTLDARAELAERRLAELESRTGTVKNLLPKRKTADDYIDDVFDPSDLAAVHNACRLECEVKLKNALAAAGIQVIEGEA